MQVNEGLLDCQVTAAERGERDVITVNVIVWCVNSFLILVNLCKVALLEVNLLS